jgi:hypothetical protein
LSEAAFLELQAEQARVAMSKTLQSVGDKLGRGLNPGKLTREHPLMVLGVAAAAGFVTIRVVERAVQKAREPSRSDNHRNSDAEDAEDPPRKKSRRGKSWSRLLVRYTVQLLRPAITGFVLSQFHPDNHEQNGSAEPSASAASGGAVDETAI